MRNERRRAPAYTLARTALGLIIADAFGHRPGLCSVEAAPPAAGGAAAAPAAAAAAAPAAGAAAAPAAAAAAAAPAAGAKPEANIVASAAAPVEPLKPTADQARAYLATKVSNAEDLKGMADDKLLELHAKQVVVDARAYLVEKGMAKDAADKLTVDEALKQAQEKGLKFGEAAKAPVEYKEFTLPEGVKADDPAVKAGIESFKAIAAAAGMSQDDAQKLVDQHFSDLREAANQPYKLWEDTQAKWQGEVKADPEIGGTNYEPMKASIAKAIDKFGGKEAAKVREAFNFTGAGNHPEIIRFLSRMAKAVNEPGHVAGGAAVTPDPKNPASVLYPNQANTQLANAGKS